MPQIPYQSDVNAESSFAPTKQLTDSFTADTFGAASGADIQRTGQALEADASAINTAAVQQSKQDALYQVAQYDPKDALAKVNQTVDPTDPTYSDQVRSAYLDDVDTYVNNIDDDMVRHQVRKDLLTKVPSYVGQAQNVATAAIQQDSKDKTNAILYTQQNNVLNDPTAYDDARTISGQAIELYGQGMNPKQREAMTAQNDYDLTKTYFTGQVQKASTPAQLAAIQTEITSTDKPLLPRDAIDLQQKIISGQRTMENQSKSAATGILEGLKPRSEDPTTLIPDAELTNAQQVVSQSGDVGKIQQMARITRNQQIVRSERGLTSSQLQANIDTTNAAGTTPGSNALPAPVNAAINTAATNYGISASYLNATASREYGSVIGAAAKAGTPVDYGVTGPGGTSTGLFQFNDATWLGLTKDPAVASAIGVTPGMSQQQVLDLRKDPNASVTAGAILAKQNQTQMTNTLGRPVSDAELYMGHFMGATQGVNFINADQTNPQADAATLFPTEAAANPSVFKASDGKTPLTVGQVYDNISRNFVATSSQATYDDNQLRKSMIEKQETAMKGPDGLAFAARMGVVSLTPLDQPGAWQARSTAVTTANAYYKRDVMPLTTDEEAWVQSKLDTGTSNDVTALMSNIQSMNPSVAKATFEQLKLKAPAFSYAGQLGLDGNPGVASDIVRGYKVGKDNPSLPKALGYKPETMDTDFQQAVGSSLADISPQDRQATQEAAQAYLLQTKGSQGKQYDSQSYRDAVGIITNNRIADVNGRKTFLPPNTTAAQVGTMLRNMQSNDYVALSTSTDAPQYKSGTVAQPQDIQDEGAFHAIGDNKYTITDGSGAYLVTGKRDATGFPVKYIIDMSPQRTTPIIQRKNPRVPQPGIPAGATMMGGF